MTPRWHDPALLEHLVRVRQPWDRLTRRIVRAALAKFLPDPPGPLVEIGAGGGQLREWLSPELATQTTHTEPSEPFLQSLRSRYPGANAIAADATRLPFDDGTVSSVLALCVLDTLPDLATVRDELHRVLRAGGVVLHILDLATSPDALFPELIAGGEIPLTNFARDPALLAVLTDSQKAQLPPANDFDEVLAIPWEPFTRFVRMLEAARQPVVANLGPYAQLHQPGRLDPDRLAHDYMATTAHADQLLALNRTLLKLTLTAHQMGREWPLRAVSARTHVRNKLTTAFGPEHGFAIAFAGPVGAWEVASENELPEGTRFLLRHAGRTTSRTELGTIPGTPVEELEGGSPQSPTGHAIRATTVELFAACKETPN